MRDRQTIGLTFANYNPAFTSFYDHYKNLCFKISSLTEIKDISTIRKIITTFVYENEYAIEDVVKRNVYIQKLLKIKHLADNDLNLKNIIKKDLEYTINKIRYRRLYYKYFLKYLKILGDYVSELSSTFLPNTNMQRKLLRFTNNQMFFEKFTDHKDKVVDTLSEFTIRNFTEAFNNLVTFFFAYSLFVNEEDKSTIYEIFSNVLTYYLSSEILSLLSLDEPTMDQSIQILKIESGLHRALLFSLSLMNKSFSNYDVLPKIQRKVYIDKTLI